MNLQKFLEIDTWNKINDLLRRRLNISYLWVVDSEGRLCHKEERSCSYCKLIKSTDIGRTQCEATIQRAYKTASSHTSPLVFSCHAHFLGFCIPLLINGTMIGAIGACQIINEQIPSHQYLQVAQQLDIIPEIFLSAIKNAQFKVSKTYLEDEVELITTLIDLSLQVNIQKQQIDTHQQEMKVIAQFYQLFEESRQLMLTLDPQKLYQLIVNLTARTLDAEICSLMLVDKETNEVEVKAAVGLDTERLKSCRLKVGKGIVGFVLRTGEPLLVKDITKDTRFKIETSSPQYYTKSLISAPLRVEDEIFGVINVNNKATREPFTEKDLKLLSIICGYAAVAIKNLPKKIDKAQVKGELKELIFQKEQLIKEQERLVGEKELLMVEADNRSSAIEEKTEKLQQYEKHLTKTDKLTEDEYEFFRREQEKLQKEIQQLHEERQRLLEQIKEKEELIKENQRLLEEREELIREKEELEAQTEELAVLYSISREIPLLSEVSQILSEVLDKIRSFFGYHAAGYLFEEEKRLIGEIKATCHLHDTCTQWLKQTLQTQWKKYKFQEADKTPVFKFARVSSASEIFWVGEESFKSHLVSPITHRGKHLGVLLVASFNEGAFTPLQRRVLTIISNQTALNLERVRLFMRIKELAERDELTGIFNYRYFEDYLEREFNYVRTYSKNLSLIMLDFDYLKKFNDTYGHKEGNRLIVTIVELIKESLDGRGCLARFGGDEFVVVLTECDQNTAYNIAETIRENIVSHQIVVDNKAHQLSVSLGVATYPNEGINDKNDLLAKADKALYEAKKRGRNRVVVYTP